MAKGGANEVDETVVLTGTTAPSALDRVEIALRGLAEHQVVRQGPSVLQIARTDRSLLGRKVAVCVVSAATEPQRVSVSLIGDLLPSVANSIRGALHGPVDRATPAMTFAPTYQPAPDASPFVPPDDWFLNPYDAPAKSAPAAVRPAPPAPGRSPTPPAPPVAPQRAAATPPPPPPNRSSGPTTPPPPGRTPTPPPPPAGATVARPANGPSVKMPDGRVLTIRGPIIVGRAPMPRPGDEAAVCVAIADGELSKTHCVFGVELVNGDLLAWVEDMFSTNGSAIAAPGRPPVVVEPGSRVYAKLPATLEIGATRLVVHTQGGGG